MRDYPEAQRQEMMELMFSPSGGAALHWLKVEIGGDTDSTCGTEPSHMRTPTETPNLVRGYEGWLLSEAKKLNPDIGTWALSWGFPSWIGEGVCESYGKQNCTNDFIMNDPVSIKRLAHYTEQFIKGLAGEPYHINLDRVGIWNEDSYSPAYIKTLRATLDSDPTTTNVAIVGPDLRIEAVLDVLTAMENDTELVQAFTQPMGALAVHYPYGSDSDPAAVDNKWNIPIWSAEDSSTNDEPQGGGPGCWARVLNWNYVKGHYTSTTIWSLVSAWTYRLVWYGAGLFSAPQPWSGHYDTLEALYVTGHWTQFAKP